MLDKLRKARRVKAGRCRQCNKPRRNSPSKSRCKACLVAAARQQEKVRVKRQRKQQRRQEQIQAARKRYQQRKAAQKAAQRARAEA